MAEVDYKDQLTSFIYSVIEQHIAEVIGSYVERWEGFMIEVGRQLDMAGTNDRELADRISTDREVLAGLTRMIGELQNAVEELKTVKRPSEKRVS